MNYMTWKISAPHIILDMDMAEENGIVTVTQPQEGLPRLDDRLSCSRQGALVNQVETECLGPGEMRYRDRQI